MDFLLKDDQIVIEAKRTSKTHKDREIGKELTVDIAQYAGHPDCKTLVCFVYDPETHIQNPQGLKKDLEKQSKDDLTIIVHVAPR